MQETTILVINGGSSTYKCALFSLEELIQKQPTPPKWETRLEWEGEEKLKSVLEKELRSYKIAAIGHRVVHGGEEFVKPCRIDEKVKQGIQNLSKLAPQHNPQNLKGIQIAEQLFPNAIEVAVFDTAFHAQIPEYAATYPIPYHWRSQHIRRFGFHGINHEYCLHQVQKKFPNAKKIITCHLGNGASLAAIKEGNALIPRWDLLLWKV